MKLKKVPFAWYSYEIQKFIVNSRSHYLLSKEFPWYFQKKWKNVVQSKALNIESISDSLFTFLPANQK